MLKLAERGQDRELRGSRLRGKRGRLSPSCVVLTLGRKPRGSSAAQASGEECGTPACVSDPPHGLEPAGSSAHPQRGKESPLTTPRGHTLVFKVFITVFGRDCCVYVLRERKKKIIIQSTQGLSKLSPPTTSVSPSDSPPAPPHPRHHPHRDPLPAQVRGPFPISAPCGTWRPGLAQKCVCARGLIRGLCCQLTLTVVC